MPLRVHLGWLQDTLILRMNKSADADSRKNGKQFELLKKRKGSALIFWLRCNSKTEKFWLKGNRKKQHDFAQREEKKQKTKQVKTLTHHWKECQIFRQICSKRYWIEREGGQPQFVTSFWPVYRWCRRAWWSREAWFHWGRRSFIRFLFNRSLNLLGAVHLQGAAFSFWVRPQQDCF